jgi:hypothetical protein
VKVCNSKNILLIFSVKNKSFVSFLGGFALLGVSVSDITKFVIKKISLIIKYIVINFSEFDE